MNDNIKCLEKLLNMYGINQNIDKISLISNLCIKRNNLIDILNELNIDYIISNEIEEKGLIITEKKYYFKYKDNVEDVFGNKILIGDIRGEYIFLTLNNKVNKNIISPDFYKKEIRRELWENKVYISGFSFVEILKVVLLFFGCVFIRTLFDAYLKVENYEILFVSLIIIIIFLGLLYVFNEIANAIIRCFKKKLFISGKENDNNIKIICTLFSFPFTAILMFYLSSYINIYFFKSMVICFVIDLLIYKLLYDILEKSIITINRNVLIVLNIIFNFLIIMTLLFNFYVLCSLYEKKLISIGIIIIGLIYDIYLNMHFIDPILTIKSFKEYILILENNILKKANSKTKHINLNYLDEVTLSMKCLKEKSKRIVINNCENILFIGKNKKDMLKLRNVLNGNETYDISININNQELSSINTDERLFCIDILDTNKLKKRPEFTNCLKTDLNYLFDIFNLDNRSLLYINNNYSRFEKSIKIKLHLMSDLINNKKVVVLYSLSKYFNYDELQYILMICSKLGTTVIGIENNENLSELWNKVIDYNF